MWKSVTTMSYFITHFMFAHLFALSFVYFSVERQRKSDGIGRAHKKTKEKLKLNGTSECNMRSIDRDKILMHALVKSIQM